MRTRWIVWIIATQAAACGHPSPPADPRAPAKATPIDPSAASMVTPVDPTVERPAPPRPEPQHDRCAAWVESETDHMRWFIGERGLLDYVDLDRLPAVIRAECDKLDDRALACVSEVTEAREDKLRCLSGGQRDEFRAALLPLLDLPAGMRATAKAAKTCEYGKAIQAMNACGKVPDRYRQMIQRAWSSAVNYNPLPFACQVGLDVMQQRLASVGC
jgi:hypothetical protein